MSKKRLAQAIATVGGLGILATNYDRMLGEAEKEFDPINTTLDGLEEYVLDPIGELTPRQALYGAGIGLTGLAGYKALKRLQESKEPQKG